MTFLETADQDSDEPTGAQRRIQDEPSVVRRRIVDQIIKIVRDEVKAIYKDIEDVSTPQKEAESASPKLDWDNALERCNERSEVIPLIRLSGFDKVADQIVHLLGQEDALEPEDSPLILHSLKGCANFLRKERRLEHPAVLTISPDGSLVAEWHYGSNRHLAVKFVNEHTARFASIAPTRSRPDQTRSLSGTVPLIELVDSLSPVHVTEWKNG